MDVTKTAFAESQNVAIKFSKEHKTIIATIERLIIELKECGFESEKYFYVSSFKNDRNRKYRNYSMTNDGYSLLGMSLSGEKAIEFKTKLIQKLSGQ